MRASVCQLRDLYTTFNKAYVIPSYQRPFAWSRDKAAELLETILSDANDDEISITSLGTLLFHPLELQRNNPYGNNLPTSNAVNTIWEVIDGQQRLTTLALIGKCLNDRLRTLQDNGLIYQPNTDLQQLYCTYRRVNGRPMPLIIRDGDNFDTGFNSEISRFLDHFNNTNQQEPIIGDNLRLVYEGISNWVWENLDASNFQRFCDHFLDRCSFIQVEASEENQAFTLFETLNSTSEPLTAFEVYKSRVVRDFPSNLANFEYTNQYLNYSDSKRDEITKKSNDLVFFHGQVWCGIRTKIHFVYLKKYLDRQLLEDRIIGLDKISLFLKDVWDKQNESFSWLNREAINHIRFLKASKHVAPIPLLVRYFVESPNDLPRVLEIICGFFVLWRSGLPNNKLPEAYRSLFDLNSQNNMAIVGGRLKRPHELASYFREILVNKIGPPQRGVQTERMATLKQSWINNFQRNLNYDELPTICRLVVLLDVESRLRGNLIPDDPWTKLDDIEHIYSQANATTDVIIQILNSIGNLTFLPPTINRSIQNIEWEEKRQIYQLLSKPIKTNINFYENGEPLPEAVVEFLREPNSPCLAYLGEICSHKNWGEAEIRQRNSEMLNRIWEIMFTNYLRDN
jgi:hypothetical protein